MCYNACVLTTKRNCTQYDKIVVLRSKELIRVFISNENSSRSVSSRILCDNKYISGIKLSCNIICNRVYCSKDNKCGIKTWPRYSWPRFQMSQCVGYRTSQGRRNKKELYWKKNEIHTAGLHSLRFLLKWHLGLNAVCTLPRFLNNRLFKNKICSTEI